MSQKQSVTTKQSGSAFQNVFFVSLGCPKNQVDTERMVALAKQQGLSLVQDAAESDIIVVNTCGFIESAKQESIDTILEMSEYKHRGQCRALVVAGCLSQRYPEQLAAELPEVDHFLGTADLPKLATLLERLLAKQKADRLAVGLPDNLSEARFERQLIGPAHTAYLKISEGCNRPCAFCSIPIMRGRQRSRTIESLVEEATLLAENGVRELILIAQDSTAYGRDLGRGTNLGTLLRALNEIEMLHWIRIHYAYPSMVTGTLIEAIASLERVAPYIDMPIQHADDEVLRRMRRGYTGDRVRQTIAQLRTRVPDMFIRSTMLVGHPGETEAGFQKLLEFLDEVKLDHVGCFAFSPEEGTHAFKQGDLVPSEIAEARRDAVMRLQQKISRQNMTKLVDKTITTMIDGPSDESEFLLKGRHAGQAPDVDGIVILTDAQRTYVPGELVSARVTDASEYDLVASLEL